jgi:hypothetical protein
MGSLVMGFEAMLTRDLKDSKAYLMQATISITTILAEEVGLVTMQSIMY